MSESATVTLPGGARVPKKVAIGVLGGLGVFIVWRYMRAGSAPAAAEGLAQDSDLSVPAGADIGGQAGGTLAPVTTLPTDMGSATYRDPTETDPTTNTQWYDRALAFAAQIGYDPTVAAESIGRYLAGQATTGDKTMITTLLGRVGTPPQGGAGWLTIAPGTAVPPTAGQPATTTPATPTAAPKKTTPVAAKPAVAAAKNTAKNYGWFLSKSANNTQNMIAKLYGISSATLRKLNPALKADNKIPVGMAVKVRSTATAKYVA